MKKKQLKKFSYFFILFSLVAIALSYNRFKLESDIEKYQGKTNLFEGKVISSISQNSFDIWGNDKLYLTLENNKKYIFFSKELPMVFDGDIVQFYILSDIENYENKYKPIKNLKISKRSGVKITVTEVVKKPVPSKFLSNP